MVSNTYRNLSPQHLILFAFGLYLRHYHMFEPQSKGNSPPLQLNGWDNEDVGYSTIRR